MRLLRRYAAVSAAMLIAVAMGACVDSAQLGDVRATHFRVWAGYDADVALHPYTSNCGPCPEGQIGTGCGESHGTMIKPSKYERSPFTD
jgi:hypothetical protein